MSAGLHDDEFLMSLSTCAEDDPRWRRLARWMIEHPRLGMRSMCADPTLLAMMEAWLLVITGTNTPETLPDPYALRELSGYASSYSSAGCADFLYAMGKCLGQGESKGTHRIQAVIAHRNMAYLSGRDDPVQLRNEIASWQAVNFDRPA